MGRVETSWRKSNGNNSSEQPRNFSLRWSRRHAGTLQPTRAGYEGPGDVPAARATVSFYWYSDDVRSYMVVLLVKRATNILNVDTNYRLASSGYVKVWQEICR